MASAVDSRLAYARPSAVATASRLPTATRDSNNSYTTSWDTTHQTLHRALVVPLARAPVTIAHEVMRQEPAEEPRPPARPVRQYARHQAAVVVVENRLRNPAEEGEGMHMPVDPRLGRRRRVGPHIAGVAVRQIEDEEVAPCAPHPRSPHAPRRSPPAHGPADGSAARTSLAAGGDARAHSTSRSRPCENSGWRGISVRPHGDVRIRHETHSWH